MIRSSQALIIVSLLFVGVWLTGCGGKSANTATSNTANAANQAANEPKANGNAEELGLVVNFSLDPEDLVWKADEAKRSLTAVFRLDPEATKKLADELAQGQKTDGHEIAAEDWFPPELIAQADSSGGSVIKGTAYPAAMFYQAPYSSGTVTRVDGTDFFVLELHAK